MTDHSHDTECAPNGVGATRHTFVGRTNKLFVGDTRCDQDGPVMSAARLPEQTGQPEYHEERILPPFASLSARVGTEQTRRLTNTSTVSSRRHREHKPRACTQSRQSHPATANRSRATVGAPASAMTAAQEGRGPERTDVRRVGRRMARESKISVPQVVCVGERTSGGNNNNHAVVGKVKPTTIRSVMWGAHHGRRITTKACTGW